MQDGEISIAELGSQAQTSHRHPFGHENGKGGVCASANREMGQDQLCGGKWDRMSSF